MKVTLEYKSDQEYRSINESGNVVDIDMFPENKQAQSPTQLLLSGVVACAAVDIVSMIKKKSSHQAHSKSALAFLVENYPFHTAVNRDFRFYFLNKILSNFK